MPCRGAILCARAIKSRHQIAPSNRAPSNRPIKTRPIDVRPIDVRAIKSRPIKSRAIKSRPIDVRPIRVTAALNVPTTTAKLLFGLIVRTRPVELIHHHRTMIYHQSYWRNLHLIVRAQNIAPLPVVLTAAPKKLATPQAYACNPAPRAATDDGTPKRVLLIITPLLRS